MTAVVTLKLDPKEFKLVQDALKIAQTEAWIVGKNTEISAAQRHAAKQESAQFAQLLAKLT